MIQIPPEILIVLKKIFIDHLDAELHTFFDGANWLLTNGYPLSKLDGMPGSNSLQYISQDEADELDKWLLKLLDEPFLYCDDGEANDILHVVDPTNY